MKRQIRMALFAVMITLLLGTVALADDDDYYRRSGNGQQIAYQNGYRDGLNHGREEARERDPNDFRTRDYEQASRGYQSWMGPLVQYQAAYRDGYRQGYNAAFGNRGNRPWYGGRDGDGDRDDGYRNGDRWPSARRSPAYSIGRQDGEEMAIGDIRQRKPYNPNPRAKYDDADHGYRPEYGDKNAYRAEYKRGYYDGYTADFYRRGY